MVYIGKSKKLYARIYAHKYHASKRTDRFMYGKYGIKRITFDEVHIHPCAIEELDKLERKLIAKYHPRDNDLLVPASGVIAPITIRTKGYSFTINAPVKHVEKLERRL